MWEYWRGGLYKPSIVFLDFTHCRWSLGLALTFLIEMQSYWVILLFFFAGHIDYINEVVCYSLEFSSFISKLNCSFKVVAMILFKIFAWITGLKGGVCRFPFELSMSPALPESTICGLSWAIISSLGLLDWQLVCIWGAFCSKLASSIRRRFAARFVEPSFATINYSSYCIKVGDKRFGFRDK